MTLSEATSMLNNQKTAPNVKKKVRFTFYDPHKFKINPVKNILFQQTLNDAI